MRISNIRVQKSSATTSLLADCKIRPIGSDVIHFTFNNTDQDFIYPDASPFAAGLLVPAMFFKEDLLIEGSISRKLYDGMQRIMDTMVGWNIGLSRITIKATEIVEDSAHPTHVATFFSGGVDSFYTYLKHSKEDILDPIDHFILVRGADIETNNKKLWELAQANVQTIADIYGVKLVTVETNLHSLLEPMISPDLTHGGSLAAVGLSLRKGLKKVYIPSSFGGDNPIIPYGSHPDTDHEWGSETLSFVHDGTDATRFDKIRLQVAESPVALKYLRVCYMNTRGAYNCGRCTKCLRTMITLYALGKLDQAETFPHTLDLKRIYAVISTVGEFGTIGHRENIRALKENNKDPELLHTLENAMANLTSKEDGFVDRSFAYWRRIDHRYLRGILFKVYKMIRLQT